MRADPVNDAWDFLIGATPDQVALGDARPVFVGLFAALLAASCLIALARWLRDPEQRGPGRFLVWIGRVLIGSMWFQQSLWKLPLPVSGGLDYWTGRMADDAATPFVGDLVRTVVLTHLTLVDPLVFGLELLLAASCLLGLAVRPMAAIGLLYSLVLWLGLYRDPALSPWQFVFLALVQLQFVVYGAGRSLGLDSIFYRRRRR